MPRIPVRTEPYSSPTRQQRHYKNKRDQVLRALGKSAYINGSQFAIMWVAASGQSEVYASDAFQPRLEDWFENSGIRKEAAKIVATRGRKLDKGTGLTSSSSDELKDVVSDGDESQDEVDDGDDLSEYNGRLSRAASPSKQSKASKSNAATPLIDGGDDDDDDLFGPGPSASTSMSPAAAASPPLTLSGMQASSAAAKVVAARTARKALAPLDINTTNKQFTQQLLTTQKDDLKFMHAPKSAPLPNSDGGKPLMRAPSSTGANPSKLLPVSLANRDARTAFFELRFAQMQQGMCKTVAKAWIKIIEPKKQTRCPYNKGEEGKPEWWPAGVRHKEPDHLMKPERHALLLAILRSPKVKVARLQLATAEVVAMIRAEKVSLLMDVYRIAREEERLLAARPTTADTEPVTVGVSSLGGWKAGGGLDEAGKLATLVEDSPELDDAKAKAGPSRPNTKVVLKKRRPSAISRSASSSNVVGEKKQRLSIGGGASSSKALAPPPAHYAVPLQRSQSHHQIPNGADGGLSSAGVASRTLSPLSMSHTWSQSGGNAAYSPQMDKQAQAGPSSSALTYAQLQQHQQRQQHQTQQQQHLSVVDERSPYLGGSAGSSASHSPQFVQHGFAPDPRQQHLSQHAPHPGSLSAPQGQHLNLYPVGSAARRALEGSSGGTGRTTSSVCGSPVLNYDFDYSEGAGGYGSVDAYGQQQQHATSTVQHPQAAAAAQPYADQHASGSGSALGLSGMGVPPGMTAWHNPFEPAFMPWMIHPQQQQQGGQPSQHHGQQQTPAQSQQSHQHSSGSSTHSQQQHQHHVPFHHSAPMRTIALPTVSSASNMPAVAAVRADESSQSLADLSVSTSGNVGDTSADLSFASSAGPPTPQHQHHPHAQQQYALQQQHQSHLALHKLAQQQQQAQAQHQAQQLQQMQQQRDVLGHQPQPDLLTQMYGGAPPAHLAARRGGGGGYEGHWSSEN